MPTLAAIAHAAHAARAHAALLGRRLKKIILSESYSGLEAYLCIPTLLLAFRLLQTSHVLPLFIPRWDSTPGEHRLMQTSGTFWVSVIPTLPAAIILITNAALILLALAESIWAFRFAMVTCNLAFWFFLSTICWLHLGPGGAIFPMASASAAIWVHRRLMMERKTRQHKENQVLASARLVGEIITLYAPDALPPGG